MSLTGAAALLLAFVIYYLSDISGFKLCAINFQSETPVLSSVTLHPDSPSSSPFSNASRSVYAIVSGRRILITSYNNSDVNKTRVEIQKLGRSGAIVGWYTELNGELYCRDPGICPLMMSSGDYIGIPTILNGSYLIFQFDGEVYTIQEVRYTIFHLSTLEERAQDQFTFITPSMPYQVKRIWGQVLEHSCDSLSVVLVAAAVDFVLLLILAFQLRAQTLRHLLRYSKQSEFFRTL